MRDFDDRYSCLCRVREKSLMSDAAYMRDWRAQNRERAREIQRIGSAKFRELRGNHLKEYRKRWLEENKHRRKWYWLKARTGVTKKQYERMWSEQNGKCAICADDLLTVKPHVDHCHSTGTIWGILCELCNKGLGQFKDSAVRLESAAKYLKRFTNG